MLSTIILLRRIPRGGLRITVGDVLGWLVAGMSVGEIIADYPDMTEEDIHSCLEYAAECERRFIQYLVKHKAVV